MLLGIYISAKSIQNSVNSLHIMALSVTVHSSSIFCQKTTTTQESARKCKWTSSTRGQRDLRRAATLRAWLALQLELGSPPLLGEGLALVIKWIVMIVMLAFYNLHALWMKSSKSGKSIQTMAMTAILHGYIELLKKGQGTTAKNNILSIHIHTMPYSSQGFVANIPSQFVRPWLPAASSCSRALWLLGLDL